MVSQMEALVNLAAQLLSYFRGWRHEADLHRVIEGRALVLLYDLEQAYLNFILHVTGGMRARTAECVREGGRERKRESVRGRAGARSTSRGNNGDDNKTGGQPVTWKLNGWSQRDVTTSRSHED